MSAPFISRTDLSDRLGRDLTQDAGALSAVDAACEICRGITEQSFDQVVGDTVTLDGTGTDCLLLPQRPVTAAGTVLENGGTLTAATDYVLASGGRLIRSPSNWSWFGGAACGAVWSRGRQNVVVTYDHGAGTVPSDVREVALSLAMRMVVQGVAASETIGDTQITYATAANELTKNEERILYSYLGKRSY